RATPSRRRRGGKPARDPRPIQAYACSPNRWLHPSVQRLSALTPVGARASMPPPTAVPVDRSGDLPPTDHLSPRPAANGPRARLSGGKRKLGNFLIVEPSAQGKLHLRVCCHAAEKKCHKFGRDLAQSSSRIVPGTARRREVPPRRAWATGQAATAPVPWPRPERTFAGAQLGSAG